MNTFELPYHDGKPLTIHDFKIILQASPPKIEERTIYSIDRYINDDNTKLQIIYRDAPVDEGYLNIFICRFSTGKCRLHIFGKINGHAFKAEKEITDRSKTNTAILNEKVRYILLQSRHILKTYYNNSNLKSLENHLMAFLFPL